MLALAESGFTALSNRLIIAAGRNFRYQEILNAGLFESSDDDQERERVFDRPLPVGIIHKSRRFAALDSGAGRGRFKASRSPRPVGKVTKRRELETMIAALSRDDEVQPYRYGTGRQTSRSKSPAMIPARIASM